MNPVLSLHTAEEALAIARAELEAARTEHRIGQGPETFEAYRAAALRVAEADAAFAAAFRAWLVYEDTSG